MKKSNYLKNREREHKIPSNISGKYGKNGNTKKASNYFKSLYKKVKNKRWSFYLILLFILYQI